MTPSSSDNRYVGIELEFSDINTVNAAKFLCDAFGLDFTVWEDPINGLYSHEFDYSLWNFCSDPTIKNSDGTLCARSYIREDGKYVIASTYNSVDRNSWYGVEVISPKTNNYEKLFLDVETAIKVLLSNGATIGRALDNALHVHIDACDIDFEQIRMFPKRIYEVQEHLVKFFTFDGMPVPLYTKGEVNRLLQTSSQEEFMQQYRTLDSGKYCENKDMRIRRIVNLLPYLSKTDEHRSVEFRAYSMSKNVDYIKKCCELSLSIFCYLITGNLDIDLQKETFEIEKLQEDFYDNANFNGS